MDPQLALGWNSPLVTGLRVIKPDKTNADKPKKNKNKNTKHHQTHNYWITARLELLQDLNVSSGHLI